MSVDILVVGKKQNRDVLDAVTRNGFLPVFRSSILEASELVHHRDFFAAILDNRAQDIDVLEFILNIRDFDSQLPIQIFGNVDQASLKKAIEKLPKVNVYASLRELVKNLFHS